MTSKDNATLYMYVGMAKSDSKIHLLGSKLKCMEWYKNFGLKNKTSTVSIAHQIWLAAAFLYAFSTGKLMCAFHEFTLWGGKWKYLHDLIYSSLFTNFMFGSFYQDYSWNPDRMRAGHCECENMDPTHCRLVNLLNVSIKSCFNHLTKNL